MILSVFDILKTGVGPSSSHTLGPWNAARKWIRELKNFSILSEVEKVKITLYGSLALTGKGHATDKALMLGLSGEDPERIDITKISSIIKKISNEKRIVIDEKYIPFNEEEDIFFNKSEELPFHSNGLKFEALRKDNSLLQTSVYYSLGGGFILRENEVESFSRLKPEFYCFSSQELLLLCKQTGKAVSDIVLLNEKTWRDEEDIKRKLLELWNIMKEAAYIGCHTEGILPGGLKVKRRAAEMNRQLLRVSNYSDADGWMEAMKVGRDFRKVIMRISCLAIAVNEVNASMGRIVTAPTNGSAGVIPAVLFYYLCFSGKETKDEDICRFLLTASEIGRFFKTGATISAAAGGCQAEIGVSSSMAAGALTECLGGTPDQVLMAAEIAAEHHLGMTCDPVGGLVQIPCIERNSMGAVKAVTASMIALASDPQSAKVSLDSVIRTMKETAENMSKKYKETSLGGLAVNVGMAEC
jgi:L-serine dehydratase